MPLPRIVVVALNTGLTISRPFKCPAPPPPPPFSRSHPMRLWALPPAEEGTDRGSHTADEELKAAVSRTFCGIPKESFATDLRNKWIKRFSACIELKGDYVER